MVTQSLSNASIQSVKDADNRNTRFIFLISGKLMHVQSFLRYILGGKKTSSWGLVTSNNWSTLVEDDWMIFRRRRRRRTTDCSHLVLGSKGRRLGGIGGGLFCFVFFPPKPFILKRGKVSKCPFRHSFGLKESPGQKWSKAASDRRCVARNQAPRR